MIRYGSHIRRSVQQFSYSCVGIRCWGKVFTEPLPSNDIVTHMAPARKQLGKHGLKAGIVHCWTALHMWQSWNY
jgi:hypothetical protein